MKYRTIIGALCALAAGIAGAQTTLTIYDAGAGPATDPLLDPGWGFWDSNTATPFDLNASATTTNSGAAAWEFGDALMGGGQGDSMYYEFDAATSLEMVTSTTGFTIDIEIEALGTGGYIALGDASDMLGGGASQRYGATPGVTANPPGIETLTFTFPSGGPLTSNFGTGSGGSSGNWLGAANTLRLNLADNSKSSSLEHFKLVSLKVTYTPGGTPPAPDFAIGGDTSGGTPDVTDVSNWMTNSVAYIQDAMVGTNDGYILDWEEVTQTAVVDAPNNEFDGSAVGGPGFTSGILYMYTAESVDLSLLADGITRLGMSGTFTSSTLNNWIPVMAITEGGVTRYYRSNNTGNAWSGAGSLKVFFNSLGTVSNSDFAGLKPADGTTTHINFTRDLDTTPVLHQDYVWDFGTQQYNLEGTLSTGTATFGFIQWGSSGSGSVNQPAFSTTVQSFEVNGFSDAADIVQPADPQGLAATGVDSSTFTYKYEMDSDPTGEDFDSNALADWFTGVSGGGTHPQTYSGGVAFSNHDPSAPPIDLESVSIGVDTGSGDVTLSWTPVGPADVGWTDDLELGFTPIGDGNGGYVDLGGYTFSPALGFYEVIPTATVGVPEILFRNDAGGTLFRDTLINTDFTMEVRARVIGVKDDGDVGILGFAIDPGGAASALRMQVDLVDVTQNIGSDLVATGANDDVMHTYRIAYIYADDYYFVWRDGVLIYGDNTDIGIHGTNGGFSNLGTTWVGDFSGTLSGEWEVDYIRFEPSAVAP